jgi:hypothetical protein
MYQQITHTYAPNSSSPNSLDPLHKSYIIDLEFVNPDQYDTRRNSQPPDKESVRLGKLATGNVIRNHGIKANVRMQDDGGAKEGVHDGGVGPRNKGGDDEGNQCNGEGSFKGPVV